MIIVIADDLTGAAEVAGIASQRGLTAEVHIDRLLPSDCDVVVIDADSRSCTATQAAQKVRRIALQVRQARPRMVFKKVDSVLRGPIRSELRAMQEVFEADRVLLINANPRKGRVVQGGRLFIDGRSIDRTAFARDPEHPRLSACVETLLDAWPQDVRSVKFDRPLPETGLLVGDAASECELIAWSRVASRMTMPRCTDPERAIDAGQPKAPTERGAATLLAGAAEFFQALVAILAPNSGMADTSCDSPLVLEPDSLLVTGSPVGSLQSFPVTKLSVTGEATNAFDDAVKQLRAKEPVVLHCQATLASNVTASSAAIVQTAHDVLKHCRPRHLWIEGGRTASALVRACNWQRLAVRNVHGDGVVRLTVADDHAPQLVLKPGSYCWPSIAMDQPASQVDSPADEAVA